MSQSSKLSRRFYLCRSSALPLLLLVGTLVLFFTAPELLAQEEGGGDGEGKKTMFDNLMDAGLWLSLIHI